MKKIYASFLLIGLLTQTTTANNIQSFSVIPANPTTADSIKIIIECVFTSGGCDGTASLTGITGNQIYADALHCVGLAAVICTEYDTVILPPLAAGTYTFNLNLNSGQGIPCTPGIIADDVDSVNFTVTDATGIHTMTNENFLLIFPNPSRGSFTIKQNSDVNSIVKIFSLDGALIKSIPINNSDIEIENLLSAGVYIIMMEGKERRLFRKLTIIN